MFIKKVYLKNFRNYKSLELDVEKGLNVIYGSNAQGKTNFLEALNVASIGKSFKSVTEKEMIFFGERFADIRVDYFSSGRDMYNTIRLFTEKKKMVTLNGVNLVKMSELVGKLTVVVFTPGELSLVKDGPAFRRRFLDMMICQLRPGFMGTLSAYNRLIEQKNKLLKEIKQKPYVSETLDIWDEQLASYGAEIMLQRKLYLERIMTYAEKYHLEISKEKEKLSAKIKSSVKDEENIREALKEALSLNREREIFLASSVIGPHRDDIEFFINGNSAKVFGSQGQQRTLVLSLKLAQKDLFYDETEEEPVLLLDDITGELDTQRREYLFSKIKNSQVFITCTDTDRAPDFDKASYFKVSEGKIVKE